jgi:transcriptional regulator with XRE-family HTH domain
VKGKQPPNPIDKHVGNRVRMRRMIIGMSQEKLGFTVDLTFQQIQKYEKGMNRISASRLHQFSIALGVPIAFFFEGTPSGEPVGGQGRQLPPPDLAAQFFSLPYAGELAKSYVVIAHNADRRVVADVALAIAGRSVAKVTNIKAASAQ